jgi:DNA-binding transcriptional regulator YiaG
MSEARYHYRESGLDNIYLINGFRYVDTPRGRSVVIENLDGLHRAIAKLLIHEKKTLSGREFRFLRHELNLSQASLALSFGVNSQAVARWEKPGAKVPSMAERMMRALYEEHAGGNQKVSEMLRRLAELDELTGKELAFRDTPEGWQPAKAA